jgi:hypothetical protein
VMRCLQKEPAQRYAHAGELGAALAPFVQQPTPSSNAPALACAPAQRSTDAMAGTVPAVSSGLAPGALAPSYGAGPSPAAGWPMAGAAVSYGTGGSHTAPSAMAFAPAPVAARTQRWPWVVGALVLGAGLAAGVALFVRFDSDASGTHKHASGTASSGARATEPSSVPTPSAEPTTSPGRGGGTRPGPGAPPPSAPPGKTSPSSPGVPAAAASTPSVAPASGKAAGALRQLALSCWSTTEGAKKGQPADSATITLTATASGSRSVLVSGAPSATGFRACVVNGAVGIPVDPGESPVQASVTLKAGPP